MALLAGPMARTVPEVRRETKHLPLLAQHSHLGQSDCGRSALHTTRGCSITITTSMYHQTHQTHYPSGRHVHNVVFDWRLLRPRQERQEPSVKPVVDSRQLDYLYSQLEQLKTNMREKQSSLANVSVVSTE